MITLIAAVDKNFLIGNGMALPWQKLTEDMKFFREKTLGKTVVMGKTTFESIGKPLPNRKNIVLSLEPFSAEGTVVYDSIDPVLKMAESEEIMIIGGATIYKLFLPYAHKLYLTFIDHEFEGNVYFPLKDLSAWKKTEEQTAEKSEANPYKMVFTTFEKST